ERRAVRQARPGGEARGERRRDRQPRRGPLPHGGPVMRSHRLTLLVLALVLSAAKDLAAQTVKKDVTAAKAGAATAALDRAVPPTPGAAPAVHVPTWTRTRLPNGADLVVVEKHDLPLVSFSINFVGGSYNFEPADKLGVAS